MRGYLTTQSGKRVSLVEPHVDTICIADITHALAHLCHWTGHCRQFFSVAQHSVIVSMIVPPHLAPWGLMHDAAEAYVGDVARPLKVLLPRYKEIETNLMRCIAAKFNLPFPEPKELKAYDNQVLALEAKHYMSGDTVLHDGFGNALAIEDVSDEITPDLIRPWTPIEARWRFERQWIDLFSER